MSDEWDRVKIARVDGGRVSGLLYPEHDLLIVHIDQETNYDIPSFPCLGVFHFALILEVTTLMIDPITTGN